MEKEMLDPWSSQLMCCDMKFDYLYLIFITSNLEKEKRGLN